MASEGFDLESDKNMLQEGKKMKVLVLQGGKTPQDAELLKTLSESFDLELSNSVEEALAKLKDKRFDGLFTETADFLPLERAVVSERALSILNTVGEGICVVDRCGTIMWANFKMEGYNDSTKKEISERSQRAFQYFEELLNAQGEADAGNYRPRKYSFTDEETNRYYEMTINPMLDEKGQLTQVAAVVLDQTSNRKMQRRIDAIDKAGRELVRLEAETLTEMTVEERIKLIEDKIVRYAKELLHFDNFVVRLLNRQNNQLEVLIGVGMPNDTGTEIFAHVDNNGITGHVAATGRSYICNDPDNDRRYLPGLNAAQCSLTVPLLLHDKVIGTLNVESDSRRSFTEDDRQMAEIFGRHIAIALNILDLLVLERYQTTGQAAESLNQSASEPLNVIMSQASLLMEDYIGHDDIRQRMQGIIDNVVKIKSALKDVQAQPKGILGVHVNAPEPDPLLLAKHILVVDDEEFIRQTIAGVVQKYGCIADTARDGREAKAMLTSRKYDLIISDIKLPYASGYEIFAAARSLDHEVPVILMTGFGYDPNHSIVRANKEGLTAILYKPFRVEQLITEIRKGLSKEAT